MPPHTDQDSSTVEVVDVPEASRFEVRIDGRQVGFAEYMRTNELVVYPHTVVDPAYNGRGLGSALARAVLDDARERKLAVLATCPFIAAYLARHPEYHDLAYQNRSKVVD
ncbi:GNAT family N-acetyltransferase [Streptomyces sp. NPDC090106]|uniref:GNAT family N-acetyltransferase n=1 Tax=Streptomyces sp. NPDC090106 TaxID=3365946 RepID=UPI00380AC55E